LFDGGFGCFEGRHKKALILKAAHFEHSNAGSSLSTVYWKHTFVRYYELLKTGSKYNFAGSFLTLILCFQFPVEKIN
jgi:hypothetical protein